MSTPAHGVEQPQALVHGGGLTTGKQLWRKGPGGPGNMSQLCALEIRRLIVSWAALREVLPAG